MEVAALRGTDRSSTGLVETRSWLLDELGNLGLAGRPSEAREKVSKQVRNSNLQLDYMVGLSYITNLCRRQPTRKDFLHEWVARKSLLILISCEKFV